MRIEVEGVEALKAKFAVIPGRVDTNVNRAVAESGEDLLTQCLMVTPIAPVFGGELRRSGYVHHMPGEAKVGFSADYAFYVHEMGITVYPERAPIHWTAPGTGAKFLTGPFNINKGRYANHIKDAARKGINV